MSVYLPTRRRGYVLAPHICERARVAAKRLAMFGWRQFTLRAIVCAIVCMVSPSVLAADHRFAIVVGNNIGMSHETQLRYAEDDARSMRDVLRELGEFSDARTRVLLGADANTLRSAIEATRLDVERSHSSGHDTMLLVYFSGHADDSSWHMGSGEAVLREQLESELRAIPAAVRIVITDACRTKRVLRGKGGRQIPVFEVRLDDQSRVHGTVYLHSSSAGELAHESDELRASLFTHYLVSGLRGAADDDGDAVVELREAFRHASERTLAHVRRHHATVQRPSFDYELEGHRDIVVTRLEGGPSGRLAVPAGYSMVVQAQGKAGRRLGEIPHGDENRILALASGRYFVSLLDSGTSGFEGWIVVRARRTTYIHVELLDPVVGRPEKLPTKGTKSLERGFDPRPRFHGLGLHYRVSTPVWPRATPCQGTAASYTFARPRYAMRARMGWCRDEWRARQHAMTNDMFELDLGIGHRLTGRVLELQYGVHAGASWMHQSLQLRRELVAAQKSGVDIPEIELKSGGADALAYYFGVHAQLSISVHARIALILTLEAQGIGFRHRTVEGSVRALRFRGQSQLGIAHRF